MTREQIIAFHLGVKEGMWRYAWWKDGRQYVGTSGKEWVDACDEVDEECRQKLAKYGYEPVLGD